MKSEFFVSHRCFPKNPLLNPSYLRISRSSAVEEIQIEMPCATHLGGALGQIECHRREAKSFTCYEIMDFYRRTLSRLNTATGSLVTILILVANSDGGRIHYSGIVEHCLYHHQDEWVQSKRIGLKNNVLWSYAHGANLRLDALKDAWTNSVFEKIDVVYRRHNGFSDSAPIQMPNNTTNAHTTSVTFRDINISDKNTTKVVIYLQMDSERNGRLNPLSILRLKVAS